MDGGVLAGRFLVEKQFFKRSGFGRDFGGSRLRYIADREIDQSWTSSIDNVPNVVMRKRD